MANCDRRNTAKLNLLLLLHFFLFSSHAAGLSLSQATVQTWATWSEAPPQITLNWVPDQTVTQYWISRKPLGVDAWTLQLTLPGNSAAWTDTNVQTGLSYEYQIRKEMNGVDDGFGYICAGIRAPVVESRGKLILLVEQSLAAPLTFGLARLQQDLVGDGWQVIRHDIAANADPTAVKSIIKADYLADPNNTRALFLFGHIPVPYSGNIAPDGHDDHRGAWPADVYYGEFDGQWTDTTVTATNAAGPFNRNIPGDGKFDQNHPPGKVRLQIGRVDLSNLTCFANKVPARSELDLARQYLAKDHAFRHGQLNIPRRSVLYVTSGGLEEEPTAALALRSFPSFFGTNQMKFIGPGQFLPYLSSDACLWAFVASSGGMTFMNGVASSDDFAAHDPKVIFTSFMGSYFGDWNRESNFLRASLGTSTHLLTTFYGGQPQWILHTMSLGETVGASARITQNNGSRGPYGPHRNFGVGEVHVALMGDPTLRLHPVKPPAAVTATSTSQGRRLQWATSTDENLMGYFVYKANSAEGPYLRISGATPLSSPSFLDASASAADVYMVRALKLEETPAGSYYNLSQAAFYPNPLTAEVPDPPTDLIASQITPGAVKMEWLERTASAESFLIERRSLPNGSFQIIKIMEAVSNSYLDHPPGSGHYSYRIKSIGATASSGYSLELVVNLQPPAADLIEINTTQGGDWRGVYGQEGYVVIGAATNLPTYVTLTTSNNVPYTKQFVSQARSALRRPDGSSGTYSYWVAPSGALQLSLRFSDSTAHRVALYFVDASRDRAPRIEVIDPFTGNLITATTIGDHMDGNYVVFDLLNYADIRISPGATNQVALLSGVFFSEATLDTPVITPATGGFPGKTTVAMNSTPGATIRFTTDHTVPTQFSPVYTGPFTLTTNISLLARAFKNGYADSAFAGAVLTNSLRTVAVFAGMDAGTAGDWLSAYGAEGYWIAGAASAAPLFAELIASDRPFTWSDPTTDARALRKNPQTTARIAGCWFSPTETSFDLNLYSEDLHTIALYFLDWDRAGRIQEITITDPTGAILDQRRIEDFGNGKYLTWNASGSLRIRIRSIAGPNAILNGLFVSPKAGISQAPAHMAAVSANLTDPYQIRLAGQPGQTFNIESTTDFRAWTFFSRQTLSGTNAACQVPRENGTRFYRAVLVP